MKLKEYIFDEQEYKVLKYLTEKDFKGSYNEYCPGSIFFTKDIKDNKTLYVREDLDIKYNKYHIYFFTVWVRDNNKSIFDKTQDSGHKLFRLSSKIDELIKTLKEMEGIE